MDLTRERRKYIRLGIPIDIILRQQKQPSKEYKIPSKNISASGTLLELGEQLEIGEPLELKLVIPNAPNPVHAIGEVVWTTKEPDKNIFNTGIQFVKIEEDNKNTFLKFLCDAIYKSSS